MEVSDSPGARPGSSFTHAPYHRHRKKYTSNLATGECSLSKFCVCVYACVCVCVRVCGLPYRGLPYRGLPYRGLLYGLPYRGLPFCGCYLCVCMCERAVSKCVCMCVFCESCPKQEPRYSLGSYIILLRPLGL